MRVAKQIALAMKSARNCDGIMMVQNNEPASGQHAFHYHLHVFPRFKDDHIHENMLKAQLATPEERLPFADKLQEYFS
jgi:histidine triad (HIT) family protein